MPSGQPMPQLNLSSFEFTPFQPTRPAPVDLCVSKQKLFKTEMCKNWVESGFCRYRMNCKYAHGFHELVNKVTDMSEPNYKYKSKHCKQFRDEQFCPYGSRCHFRHDDRPFKKLHKFYYTILFSCCAKRYYKPLVGKPA